MTSPMYDDEAFREVDQVATEFPTKEQRAAMLAELDRILNDCELYGFHDGAIYVDAAMEYLDRLAMTPSLLHWLLVDSRLAGTTALTDDERDRLVDYQLAALLQSERGEEKAVGRATVPLTCASPEAHRAQARRTMPTWWLRLADLLDGKPDDNAPCVVCHLPLPKSHRRNG